MPFNSAPTPSQPGNCVDSPSDWFDSDGDTYNCEWYDVTGSCENLGDGFANNGITAKMACCACGGGSTNGTPAPNPAPTPDPQNCPSGESLFRMTIKTGSVGSDTLFIVKKNQNGWQRVMRGGHNGDRFPNFMEIVREECLPTNGCYKVIVKDLAGDGMGLGWYKFSWKGQFMKLYIFHRFSHFVDAMLTFISSFCIIR